MLIEVEKRLAELDAMDYKIQQLKLMEEQYNTAKKELYEYMLANDYTSLESNHLVFTLVRPSLPKTEIVIDLDIDKLREEQPQIYARYLTTKEKTTNGKSGYIRTTIKKEEE